MDRREGNALTEARALARQLRDLADVAAPPTILPTVLQRVGLEDGYAPLDTPLGTVFVAFNRTGVSAVMAMEDPNDFERAFQARFGRPVHRTSTLPASIAYGGTSSSRLRFDLRGVSEFERAVLLKALEIPRGEVRPYAWIAREIGHPRAVRAVGSALKRNPVPLLIPCHRVVRSDSTLGEYALGSTTAKRTVLAAEGVDADALEGMARRGMRYTGSDTTRIFCFPTCRHARRVMDVHRVTFRSEGDARGAGYRPCKVCRPAIAS
jgi:O-6-methylguanine DNA methyltransferase